MVGTLNLWLDPELSFTWREASLLAAKAAGRGVKHARNVRAWLLAYLRTGKLPLHRYGQYHSSVLEDEDLKQMIQLHLQSIAKAGYVKAQDIVDFMDTKEIQDHLGTKTGISVSTACRWLHRLDWQYRRKQNGMYLDGHEREDVVNYCKEFLQRWAQYEKRTVTYDKEGKVISTPVGFPVPGGRFRSILVTHDESTFYANDRRKTKWTHSADKATPERKGDGPSLMVSDFLTPEWGRLKDDIE
jgi:transposase